MKNKINDDDNPRFLLNGISLSLLIKLAKKEIDVDDLVKKELSNRGIDENGTWIGFS